MLIGQKIGRRSARFLAGLIALTGLLLTACSAAPKTVEAWLERASRAATQARSVRAAADVWINGDSVLRLVAASRWDGEQRESLTEVNLIVFGTDQANTLSIYERGDSVWVKRLGGAGWEAAGDDPGLASLSQQLQMSDPLRQTDLDRLRSALREIRFGGEEQLGRERLQLIIAEVDLSKLNLTVPAGLAGGAPASLRFTYAISRKTYLLRRYEARMLVDQGGKTIEITARVSFDGYGKTEIILPPDLTPLVEGD